MEWLPNKNKILFLLTVRNYADDPFIGMRVFMLATRLANILISYQTNNKKMADIIHCIYQNYMNKIKKNAALRTTVILYCLSWRI